MTRSPYGAMILDGFTIGEIAVAYAVPERSIRAALRGMKIPLLPPGAPPSVWDMDESSRRAAIIKRAAKAARTARRAK